MTDNPRQDLEREAREAAEVMIDKMFPGEERWKGTSPEYHRKGYIKGYLSAATLREKELSELKALLEKMRKDAALYADYVRRNPPVGVRDETEHEIATLRAKLEASEKRAAKIEEPPTVTVSINNADPRTYVDLGKLFNEDEEGSEFDQPCAFGNRCGGHAVYCENHGWKDAPRKCRRTWYTGGTVRDEDCPGFKPNDAQLPVPLPAEKSI